MRILQVISTMDPQQGGVSEAVRQVSDEAISLGCRVEAVTVDAPDAAFLERTNFPVHAMGPHASAFAYAPRLLPWLLQHAGEYDALIVNGLWQYPGCAVRQAAHKLGVPYFVYPHGMLDSYFKRAFPLKHLKKWLIWPWADYRVLRDAAAVCFTTEEERIRARESFWLYSANEVVVNLGIARPPAETEKQRSLFYSRFPEVNGKRLALFLGRLHPKKGCDLVLRAFAQVLASDANWHLVMAGPNQAGWQAELEKVAGELHITNRVTWTGMITGDEKWGALRSSECFFLPSHQENFGFVVAEALACGVPVLISDKVNIWREVIDAGAGFVAADTLVGAVSLLQSWQALREEERSQMRERTVSCFERMFEIRQAAAKLLETLDRIIHRPSNVYASA